MNELTEIQAKFCLAMQDALTDADGVRFDAKFLASDVVVNPANNASPIANIIASASNDNIQVQEIAFIMHVLSVANIGIAAIVHETLRKYAQSVNEPAPVQANLSEEFAREFAGYITNP